MNDFVLRGFCKKCGQQINFDTKENYTECPALLMFRATGPCEIEWFLSPKQMKTVQEWFTKQIDMRIWEDVKGEGKFSEWENYKFLNDLWVNFSKLLEENPFLVSQILREAGEKK